MEAVLALARQDSEVVALLKLEEADRTALPTILQDLRVIQLASRRCPPGARPAARRMRASSSDIDADGVGAEEDAVAEGALVTEQVGGLAMMGAVP